MQEKLSSMSFNKEELNCICLAFEWALSGYEEENDYPQFVELARKFEKAKFQHNGFVWNEERTRFHF